MEEKLEIYVTEYKATFGSDYFVTFKRGEKIITPHVFREKDKADYEVASYRHFFFGEPKPDILDFFDKRSDTNHQSQ